MRLAIQSRIHPLFDKTLLDPFNSSSAYSQGLSHIDHLPSWPTLSRIDQEQCPGMQKSLPGRLGVGG